jgi:hypothetical protein
MGAGLRINLIEAIRQRIKLRLVGHTGIGFQGSFYTQTDLHRDGTSLE